MTQLLCRQTAPILKKYNIAAKKSKCDRGEILGKTLCGRFPQRIWVMSKLDGVGPDNNRPSTE